MGKRNRDNQSNTAEEVIPPVPDRPQQCHYFVKRKKRYCHLPTRKANKYCGEHLQHEDNADLKDGKQDPKRIRIPCPYDPNHTVYQHELDNHLKSRCNSRPPEIMPDYYLLNANVNIEQNLENDKKLNELEKDEISKLLNNLTRIYDNLVPNINESICDHISMNTQREKKKVYKHVDQQASLIGHMKRLNLFRKDACYIEFGAGKGELSLHLLNALAHDTKELEEPSDPNKACHFVLVDRRNFRQKFDRHLRGEINHLQWIQDTEFHRINIDIKDLDLTKLKIATNRPVIAFSKHLCGSATDLTLSALSKLHKEHNNVIGIVIALCCHHVCKASMYPNLKFFLSNEIIEKPKDLFHLSTISSWAICGHRDHKQSEETENDDENINDNKDEEQLDNQKGQIQPSNEEFNNEQTTNTDKDSNQEESQSQNKIEHYSGLSHSDRESLGYKTKRLIDTGRLNYLQSELNFNVELVKYVDRSVSLENVALIATPKKQN